MFVALWLLCIRVLIVSLVQCYIHIVYCTRRVLGFVPYDSCICIVCVMHSSCMLYCSRVCHSCISIALLLYYLCIRVVLESCLSCSCVALDLNSCCARAYFVFEVFCVGIVFDVYQYCSPVCNGVVFVM